MRVKLVLAMTLLGSLAAASCTSNRSESDNDFAALPTPVFMERDRDLLEAVNVPAAYRAHVAAEGTGQYLVPPDVQRPAERVLLVFAPGSRNFEAVEAYARNVAPDLNAGVIGVQVERTDESHWGQYYYARHLVRDLVADGILAADARIVLAGFSGGGKLAMLVGALGGDEWSGVLAGGVNDDIASMAYRWAPSRSALELPIVVLNGDQDTVVNTYTDAVMSSMRQTGFRNARLERYEGEHQMPLPEAVEVLRGMLAE